MGIDLETSGYYNYTPMFVGVGGTAPAVKDIKLTSEYPMDQYKCMLYVLDTNRKFAKTFTWCTVDELMPEDGWYYGDEMDPTDYTLKPGESLQVFSQCPVKFTYSGQVDLGAYDFTALTAGYYMVGNQHATKMALKDVNLTADVALDVYKCMLYVLDTNRKFAKTFTWCTVDELMPEDGWYYGDEMDPTTYELEPGEVLQMYTQAPVKLWFPGETL